MSESSEIDRTPKPPLITFLEVESEMYTYTPKNYNRKSGMFTVERRNPEENDLLGLKAITIITMQSVQAGVKWLSEQQPADTDQAAELARTAISLAKINSYAMESGS